MENFAEIFKLADEEGNLAAFEQHGENLMIYPCGFAWIDLPKKSSFVAWLKTTDHGKKLIPSFTRKKYMEMWIHKFNQSMLHKQAYAERFVEVLREYGIEAIVNSKID